MTLSQSSRTAEAAQVSSTAWTRYTVTIVRRRTRDLLMTDPHWADLKPRGRRLVKLLIIWHDPATGHLLLRTKNDTIARMCDCSVSTLVRARREGIEAGFIAGYIPGDGGYAGTYTISRTPEEAEAARALRQAEGAPYWPAVPERARLGAPLIEERRGRKPADKSAAHGAPEERVEREERKPRRQRATPVARDVAQAAQQPAPTVPGWTPEQGDRDRRGAAAARAAMAARASA